MAFGCKGKSEVQRLPQDRPLLPQASVVESQERDVPPQSRMVITTDAVCRVAPDASAAVDYSYKLGDIVQATKEELSRGTYWYFDISHIKGEAPSCWIDASLTTEYSPSNPEPALVAALDQMLQHPDKARFEDYVAAENLLSGPAYSPVWTSSGLLQFRELSLIDQAISRDDARGRTLSKEPLKKAWVLSHGNLVIYFDPDDRWFVLPEKYWDLYEKNKQEPWAEDLAWTAAQVPIPSDECYADCVLDKIDRTFLQYWTRFPRGSKIRQALTEATPMAKYAVELACSSDDTDFSVPRPLLEKLRTSLAGVTAPEKGQFLDYLAQIEQKCYPTQH
jgi:hypothetical protein